MSCPTHPRRSASRLPALCLLLALALGAGRPALARATRIMFLHHSTGESLIEEGNVRQGFTTLGYEFYDHGYNEEGLRLADGSYTGTSFDVPGDNTDPDGFATIFAQPLHDPPDNTFSHLMQYDVIAFKSCFPTSNIGDDYQLDEYKSYYLSIRDRMDQYPDTIFIVVTQPPQVPGASDASEATRARAFADWLGSEEYLAGHRNVFTFDFFDHLAGSDNFLRPEYRMDDYDAHPNERANREIGPPFVEFIDQAIRSYESGVPRPTAVPATAPAEATTEPPREEVPESPPDAPSPTGMIDDFEAATGSWETSAGTGSGAECRPDTGMAHTGVASLRIDCNIAQDGWGDCGRHFDRPQDWGGGAGLSFWLRSDSAVEWLTLMVFSGDPDGPTPFEVDVEIAAADWVQFSFLWSDFERAEWADEAGLATVDPARVTGYGFSIGAAGGNLWVDDVTLVTGEGAEEPPVGSAGEPTSEPGDTDTGGGEVSGEDEEAGGGFCPLSAAVVPVGLLTLFTRRRRA